jgi:hypothetical protein
VAKLSPPATGTGLVWVKAMVPSPSSPVPFNRQEYAAAPVAMPQV